MEKLSNVVDAKFDHVLCVCDCHGVASLSRHGCVKIEKRSPLMALNGHGNVLRIVCLIGALL